MFLGVGIKFLWQKYHSTFTRHKFWWRDVLQNIILLMGMKEVCSIDFFCRD